jgi:hypothetical protein
MLKDKSQVLRLMLLLLSLDKGSNPEDIGEWEKLGQGKWQTWASPVMVPLFECMVRAMAWDPRRLDDLNSLIQDLKGHPETRDLLPDGLDEIWEPIWKARKIMEGKHSE